MPKKVATNGDTRSKKELRHLLSNGANRRNAIAIMSGMGDVSHPVNDQPKTESVIDDERIYIAKRAQYNPLKSLTPEVLTVQLDAHRMGYLWQLALTQYLMQRRDPIIMSAVKKREKAIARHGYEVVTTEDTPEALKHKAALEYFWSHMKCTDALEQNEIGGYSLLVRSMMRAVGFRYQVHEIVWKPKPGAITLTEEVPQADGTLKTVNKGKMDGLTAEFRAVPLWFFENITGRMRYLRQFGELYGQPMEYGGWMVTVGDGLMEPTGIAYAYKNLFALKNWASLIERWADPKIWGQTQAKMGSAAWNSLKQAIANIGQEFSCVVGEGGEIKTLNTSQPAGAGEALYERMVELMDRYITTLWRGGDLSTLSRGGGPADSGVVGASVQGEESNILETDDCDLVEETLHEQVERPLIKYQFGEDVEPLAHIVIARPDRKNVKLDMEVDQMISKGGGKMKLKQLAERYDRTIENPEEDFVIEQPMMPGQYGAAGGDGPQALGGKTAKQANPNDSALANESIHTLQQAKLHRAVADQWLTGLARANEPLRSRIEAIQLLANDGEWLTGFNELVKEFPAVAKECLTHSGVKHAADGLAGGITAAFFNALAEAKGSPRALANGWWNELFHPRHPAGVPEGGRFAPAESRDIGLTGASKKKFLTEFHAATSSSEPVTRPVSGAIIVNENGHVLLAHSNWSGQGWFFPKGGLDEGESSHGGAEREAREESNVSDLTPVPVAPVKINAEERYTDTLDFGSPRTSGDSERISAGAAGLLEKVGANAGIHHAELAQHRNKIFDSLAKLPVYWKSDPTYHVFSTTGTPGSPSAETDKVAWFHPSAIRELGTLHRHTREIISRPDFTEMVRKGQEHAIKTTGLVNGDIEGHEFHGNQYTKAAHESAQEAIGHFQKVIAGEVPLDKKAGALLLASRAAYKAVPSDHPLKGKLTELGGKVVEMGLKAGVKYQGGGEVSYKPQLVG